MCEKLAAKGIRTIQDLISHIPYRYEDRRNLKTISRLVEGEKAVVSGKIISARKTGRRYRPGFEAIIDDGSGALSLKWFRMPGSYLEEKLEKGRVAVASQTVTQYGALLQMVHPEIEIFDEGEELDSLSFKRIVPIYSLPESFSQKTFRALENQALTLAAGLLPDFLPNAIRGQRGWPDIQTTIMNIHFPPNDADLEDLEKLRTVWHQRLYYQEFFLLETALALSRKGMAFERSYPMRAGEKKSLKLREIIPFQLTGAQEKARRGNQERPCQKPAHAPVVAGRCRLRQNHCRPVFRADGD